MKGNMFSSWKQRIEYNSVNLNALVYKFIKIYCTDYNSAQGKDTFVKKTHCSL